MTPQDTDTLVLDPSLQTVLALAVCVHQRWADGTRAALRRIWYESASDAEASDAVSRLVRLLSPQERFWLASFDGHRKNPVT